MGLSRKQFDILRELATSGTALTQRDLEKATGYSLGTINKTVKELTDLGCYAYQPLTAGDVVKILRRCY